jgi:hypothetical protein
LAKFGKNLFLRSWLNLGNLGKVLDNGRGIMYSGSKLKSNGESKMKLNEIYSELPTPAQATVRKIIQKCKKIQE